MCLLCRYSQNADKQVSFSLLVDGKEDHLWEEKLEIIEEQEAIQEIQSQLKASVAETRKQVFQAKRQQWMRRSTMAKDILRMEALECKIYT